MNKIRSKTKKSQTGSSRSSYVDQSTKFVEWVNDLGIEKTWFGKLAYRMESSFKIRTTAILFIFCVVLSFIITAEMDPVYIGYKEGDIAPVDIKSPISFKMMDEIATAEKRVKAEESVPPIYKYDADTYENLFDNVYKGFKEMRNEIGGRKFSKLESLKDKEVQEFFANKEKFEKTIGHTISDRTFKYLTEDGFTLTTANLVVNIMEPYVSLKIVSDMVQLKLAQRDSIVVSYGPNPQDEVKYKTSDLISLEDLKRNFEWPKNIRPKGLSTRGRRILARFAKNLLQPNLILLEQESFNRRQKARDAVVEVTLAIKKGKVIIPEGSSIQANQIVILDHIRRLNLKKRSDLLSLVMALFLVSTILVLFSFIRRFSRVRIRIDLRDLIAMAVITLVSVLITKAFILLGLSNILKEFGLITSEDFFNYLTPVAGAAMMVGLLITYGEILWLFSLFMAVLFGIMMNYDYSFMVVSLLGGVAAARGVFSCKKRNDIYLAGLRAGLVQMLLIATLTYLEGGERVWFNVGWNSLAGFGSGIIAALVTMMFIPLLESMFNYTTDVKLLELSNLNHPLLKGMIVNAPGTYHHCIVVGTMCEAAAEEIGANPLLAKVGAYFHDIGKVPHAEYFVENQNKGINPHDQISPNMSKTILVAHVKDGVEMGLKYKLGEPIIDIIRQHHGTSLIGYFYNKAKQNESENGGEVREEDFRYPGPRPQFREAGIVMIADSIEAAARSLEEPTSVRLQNIVKNVIHNKFMDGQLEDCNLTLKDLKIIEKSFIRTLLTIYHQRIDYPKEAGGQLSEARTS